MGNVILLPRQSKTTMSSHGPDTAPTFSKMVLCISVRVQVWNLIEKCAPPARVMKNQQCPARLQAMPPTFPNWSRLENVGSRCKPFKHNFPPFRFERCQTSFFWFGTDLAQPVPEHMSTSANQCQPVPKHMPTSAGWHWLACALALVGMCFGTGWHVL